MPQKLADIQSGQAADLLVIILKSQLLSNRRIGYLDQHPAHKIVRGSQREADITTLRYVF